MLRSGEQGAVGSDDALGSAGRQVLHRLQGWSPRMATPARKDESSGQMTWAVHVTIALTWFDPAETPPMITPYVLMYAMHDALVKPMPGNAMTPSLAVQWQESADGLAYDFELRQGVTFHNGDPFTKIDDEARVMPIWELSFLCASGPCMGVSGLGVIPLFAYAGPYEDLHLKS
jgi:hypothetical protein